MTEREHFEITMSHYHKEVGSEACKELYLIYIVIAEWLITDGWGNIMLSAIEHRISLKYRVNAVKEVKKSRIYS